MCGMKYLLDYLVIAGVLEVDYKQSIRLQKAIRTANTRHAAPLPRIPTEGYAERIVKAAHDSPLDSPQKERDIAIIEFLFSSGCRNNEVTRLSVEDLDLDNRQALVTGKGGKQRFVFFSPEAAEAIRAYWRVRGFAGPSDPVFSRHDKGGARKHKRDHITTATIRNVVKDVANLAGVPIGQWSPHYFRHQYAETMLNRTGRIELVQDLLGHNSIDSTRRYAKIRPGELRIAHHEVFG